MHKDLNWFASDAQAANTALLLLNTYLHHAPSVHTADTDQ